jgi:hypothetical protein
MAVTTISGGFTLTEAGDTTPTNVRRNGETYHPMLRVNAIYLNATGTGTGVVTIKNGDGATIWNQEMAAGDFADLSSAAGADIPGLELDAFGSTTFLMTVLVA